MKTKIRKAGTEDIPKIMSLFNSYTSPPKSEYFFRWWNNFPSVTFCAEYEQEIVGLFVVLKRKLINQLTCGVLMGLIVGTPWRGSGLFMELGERAMNHFTDVDLFCCLTNGIGEKALERNFGFRTIDTIETMILDCDARTHDGVCRRIPITADVKFPHGRMNHQQTVMFLSDEEFRRWRFAAHPRNAYSMIQADTEGQFIIISHFQNSETGIRYADIVDYEADALEEHGLVRLFNYARSSESREVDLVTIQAVSKSPLYGICKNMGFVETDHKHYFSIKVNTPRDEYLYSSSNWLIKWGDYLR
jgi:hypothetical protein